MKTAQELRVELLQISSDAVDGMVAKLQPYTEDEPLRLNADNEYAVEFLELGVQSLGYITIDTIFTQGGEIFVKDRAYSEESFRLWWRNVSANVLVDLYSRVCYQIEENNK